MSLLTNIASYVARFGTRGGALAERTGTQLNLPSAPLIGGQQVVSADVGLQLADVWACCDRRANVIASLPLHVYNVDMAGVKTPARTTRLYQLLHERPNPRMTPFQFWRAMMLNHDLRGNAYARIIRAPGEGEREASALWPMPADQVEQFVADSGEVWYLYRLGDVVYVYPAEDVLHLQNLGNGTTGFAKIEFMSTTIQEAKSQASQATKTFAAGGKPTAVLMTDKVLRPDQRVSLLARFGEMANGNDARLFILEAGLQYQALSATPEQLQLLQSRQHTTEEICRWFDVPPVLVYHSNVTAWGSGIEQIVEGWHKFTIGPLVESLRQSVRKSVLTTRQRANMAAEFNLDALLRASPAARFTLYATAVQNGILDRDEVRQLENWPARGKGADVLTAQSNLTTLDKIGQDPPAVPGASNAGTQDPVAQ